MKNIINVYKTLRNLEEQYKSSSAGMSKVAFLGKVVGVDINNFESSIDNTEVLKSKLSNIYNSLGENDKQAIFREYNEILETISIIKEILLNYKGEYKEFSKDQIDNMLSSGFNMTIEKFKKAKVSRSERVRILPEDFFLKLFEIPNVIRLEAETVEVAKREDLLSGVKFSVQRFKLDESLEKIEVMTPKNLIGEIFYAKDIGTGKHPVLLHAAVTKPKKPWHNSEFLTFDTIVEFTEFLDLLDRNNNKKSPETIEKQDIILDVFKYLNKTNQFNFRDIFVGFWAIEKSFLRGKMTSDFQIGDKHLSHQVKGKDIVHRNSDLKYSLVKTTGYIKNPISKEGLTIWLIIKDSL